MAATLAEAIAAVEGSKLDEVARYSIRPPQSAPIDPRTAIAFVGFSYDSIRRIIRMVAAREQASIADAEEAVHDVFADLYKDRPTLFHREPTSWQGLLYTLARYRVRDNRRRNRRVTSIGLNIDPKASVAVVPWASSIQVEDARSSALPAGGEEWTRTQVIGAFQRFEDCRGRSPKARECKRINGLPSLAVVYRLFGSFSNALLGAGMHPRTAGQRRQRWTPIRAAITCRGFYRRHGYWPGSSEIERHPGTLPSTSVMMRFFRSTRPAGVQLGAQTILKSHGLSIT